MKEYVHFSLYADFDNTAISANYVPRELYFEIIKRWPQFKPEGRLIILVDAERDSAELAELLNFLKQTGRTPKWNPFPPHKESEGHSLWISGRREFDKSEIDSAKYLLGYGRKFISRIENPSENSFTSCRQDVKKQPIGALHASLFLGCNGLTKKALEREGFVGLDFMDVKIIGKTPSFSPIFILWSNLILPPVRNRLVDDSGGVFNPESSLTCAFDDLFVPPLLRFNRRDLEAFGDFDAAFTSERFGYSPLDQCFRREPRLIVSQRFRRWCNRQKFQIDWTPVVLE